MRFEAAKYLIGRIKLYLVLNLVLFASAMFLIASEAKWKTDRTQGYCRPQTSVSFPLIPYMPAVTSEHSDAKLFNFIEQYIHDVYNETVVDFHRPSNLARRRFAYLQIPLQRAIEHSQGPAKSENMKKFKDSQDTYIRLKKCNCGFVFNINAIEKIIKTKYNSVFHVTVLGEWQLTGDKQYSNEDHRLWGFKRVWLTIVQDNPSRDSKGKFLNETGFYVTHQEVEDLDYYEKDKLMKNIHRKGFLIK